MPGSTNMLMGLGCAVLGLVITGATYAIAPGGVYVVAYGAIFVGGFQFLVGFFQFVAYQMKGPEARNQAQAEASVAATLQAMLATCAADGEVQDAEVQAISQIYEHIFGQKLDADTIRSAASKMVKNQHDIGKTLAERHAMIDSSLKPLIFKAAYLVAAADGRIAENEATILNAIASSLRMSGPEVRQVISELQA